MGKFAGMSEHNLGGGVSYPKTVGVGHMKLEAPPQYSGKRHPKSTSMVNPNGTTTCDLSCATPLSDWLDVVAIRVDGHSKQLS